MFVMLVGVGCERISQQFTSDTPPTNVTLTGKYYLQVAPEELGPMSFITYIEFRNDNTFLVRMENRIQGATTEGTYKINGNTLTTTGSDGATTDFTISDDRNTITEVGEGNSIWIRE
jgi:hypothetical protein